MKVFVLNGPNLNLLGEREPLIYGSTTLDQLQKLCAGRGKELGLEVDFRQSNDEGQLVDWLQQARTGADGVVLNAAALSHYSIALRDAVQACGKPVVEVHISNIFAREQFRATSVLSPVVAGVISGLGVKGYELALEALAGLIRR
ncbi:MAG: type II 3-dehydroquinate dehydratase [Actinomycetota bacterium]